jgi:hypothetical protein
MASHEPRFEYMTSRWTPDDPDPSVFPAPDVGRNRARRHVQPSAGRIVDERHVDRDQLGDRENRAGLHQVDAHPIGQADLLGRATGREPEDRAAVAIRPAAAVAVRGVDREADDRLAIRTVHDELP